MYKYAHLCILIQFEPAYRALTSIRNYLHAAMRARSMAPLQTSRSPMKTVVVLPLVAILTIHPLVNAQQTAAPAPAAAVAPAPSVSVGTAGPDANGRYILREGEDVSLKFAQDISSKTAADGESGTTGAIVLTVLFGPIGLIKHGKDIDVKQGTALKVYVSDDIALPPVAAGS